MTRLLIPAFTEEKLLYPVGRLGAADDAIRQGRVSVRPP